MTLTSRSLMLAVLAAALMYGGYFLTPRADQPAAVTGHDGLASPVTVAPSRDQPPPVPPGPPRAGVASAPAPAQPGKRVEPGEASEPGQRPRVLAKEPTTQAQAHVEPRRVEPVRPAGRRPRPPADLY